MAGESSDFIVCRCPQCGGNLPDGGEQVICEYCGTRLIRRHAPPTGESGPTHVRGLHLKPFSYVDAQGLGMEAFSLLVPVGWQVNGGIFWDINNPTLPANISFQVFNPKGVEAFEMLPHTVFYWCNAPLFQMTCPVGSLSHGAEVRPPLPPDRLFREIVLPRFRGRVEGLQVLDEGTVPELGEWALQRTQPQPGASVHAEGRRVRVRYRWQGWALEEEILGVAGYMQFAMGGFMGASGTFWSAQNLFALRAASERLDEVGELYQVMLRSLRQNPQWEAAYQQLQYQIIQGRIRHINQIGQISRQISRNADEIRESLTDSFYRRQEVYDRLATSFSQNIRGVTEYHDPYKGYGVELPSDYRYAWTNALGEYVVTDNPNYNPNVGSNLTWTEMGPQQ